MEDAILKLCEGLLEHFCTFGLREDLIVFGYLKNKKDFDNFLDILKVYNSSYSIRSSRGKNKGIESSRIKFCEDSGLPYIPGEVIYYDCIHGEKYFRVKNSLQEQNQDQPTPKKPRLKDTRKLGCDSKLNVYIRNVFVDKKYYVPGSRSRTSKTKALDDLKDALASTDKPAMETWYFIQIALKHNHPLTGEKMNIHPVLKERIESLVKSGITSVSTIRVLLKEKVSEMIEQKLGLTQPPSSMNSSYYPNDSVIYCHIWKTILSLKKQGLYNEPLKNKNNDSVVDKKVRKKRKTKSTDKDDKGDVIEESLMITDCDGLYEEVVIENAAEHWVVALTCTVETENEHSEEMFLREEIV